MSRATELADDVLNDLMTIHERTSKGVWAQGTSSHHTVAKREGEKDYHIADFHHADDASFADVAHKYMPLLIEEKRRLDRVNAELEMALTVYVTAIATAGGGDKQLFMAAIRQADDKARAALTSSTGEPK